MSQQDVENVRRGYAALNDAYRSGDVNDFLPILEENWDPEVVYEPAGVLPETHTVRGWEGVLRFMADQMKAFRDGSMWLEPLEYIDAGDRVVVPYRFGGVARHTGIEVEFSFVHVFTMRDGKAVRVDVYETKAKALEVAGFSQ
ncbi:MAG: nuclear transport factor 2 family protein [Chloroflexota bacterium]|nr:nuclear transport factor 2 family protein [Chloroflexota bacterium]